MKKNIVSPICLLIFLFSIGCKNPEPADFLIPNGYTGRIAVIFNQMKGVKPKYLSGRRVYEIPANGILLTKFNYEYGFIDYRYFLIDETGNKILLPIYEMEHNKDGTTRYLISDKEQKGIFGHGTAVSYAQDNKAPGLEIFVSTFNGLDTIESMEHFNQRVTTLLGTAKQ